MEAKATLGFIIFTPVLMSLNVANVFNQPYDYVLAKSIVQDNQKSDVVA